MCNKTEDELEAEDCAPIPEWAESMCPDCGEEMEWCTACHMYTQLCCEDYGTCECS